MSELAELCSEQRRRQRWGWILVNAAEAWMAFGFPPPMWFRRYCARTLEIYERQAQILRGET